MCNYCCKTKLLFLFYFYSVSLLFSELCHSTLLDRHGKNKQPLRLIMWRGWPSETWRRVVWHVGICISDEPPSQSSWQDKRFLWSVCSCIPVVTLQYCVTKRRADWYSVTAFWTSYSILHTVASLPLTHPTASGMDSVACQTYWVHWTARWRRWQKFDWLGTEL